MTANSGTTLRCEWCGGYAPSKHVTTHRCSVTGTFEPYEPESDIGSEVER